MTDLMKRVAVRAKDRRGTEADFLELSSDGLPKTVYVTLIESPSGPAAGFASRVEGPFFTEGMVWRPASHEFALFIEFEFVRGIRDLSGQTILWSQPSEHAQSCALAPVPGDYPFWVQLSSGERHDPKIIIPRL